MKEQLIALAIKETPTVIALLMQAFRQEHPDAPAPTSAEVIAAFNAAFVSSLVKDDAWLAQHPA